MLVNVFLLQRRFRPLERLVDEMERADLARPGANLAEPGEFGGPEEVERIHHAFRRMLERLETERRRTSSAALAAQEQERARIARDLHDEVNQSLTGLLLRLEAIRGGSPHDLAKELKETKALANQAMKELLALARQLRPTALDDLGLKAALRGTSTSSASQAGSRPGSSPRGTSATCPRTRSSCSTAWPRRRSRTPRSMRARTTCCVRLSRDNGHAELTISDDGRGFTFDQTSRGLGIGGMRERALLVGGDLRIESRPDVGTRVRLRVPIRGR